LGPVDKGQVTSILIEGGEEGRFMATWKIEISEKKGEKFPWTGALVANNGKRVEVGEFLVEKTARSYAEMELRQLTSMEKPAPAVVTPTILPPAAGPQSKAA
jgi:hypothetical protein